MILIISYSKDEHTEIVQRELKKIGANFFRLNTDEFSSRYFISFGYKNKKQFCKIFDKTTRKTITSVDVRVVWLRRVRLFTIAKDMNGFDYKRFSTAEIDGFFVNLWQCLSKKVFWCNPILYTNLAQDSRMYQYHMALKSGLDIPDTFYTNNPFYLSLLINHYGTLALKPIKRKFVIGNRKTDFKAIFTNLLTEKENNLQQFKTSLKNTPVHIQKYVEKDYEIRLTVIGSLFFACKINSQLSKRTTVDWRRYDFSSSQYTKINIPIKLKKQIKQFMKKTHLVFGAIDLIKTKDDRYVFLEINPAGQWQWIENLTKMPISKKLAIYLKQKDEI